MYIITLRNNIGAVCMYVLQSSSIGLIHFSFHLTDVVIHLMDVSFQFTDISLQLTDALLFKFGVYLKQNLKTKNKLFSARFIFECFPSSSFDKGRLFRQ